MTSERLTQEEQETIIIKTAAEDGWSVYASIPKHRRRLAVLASKWGVSAEPNDAGGLSAVLPEKAVAFRNPAKKRVSRDPGRFPIEQAVSR